MYLLVPSGGLVPHLLQPVDLPLSIPEVEVEEGEYIPPVWCYEDNGSVFYLSDGEIFELRLSSDEEDEDEDDEDGPQSPGQLRGMSFFISCFLLIHQNTKAN